MSVDKPVNQQPIEQTPQASLPAIAAPGRPSIFASGIQIGTNFFEIRFGFGQSILQGGVPIAFQEIVEIVMSPQFAKVAAKSIADAVQTYEKQFGSIPSPPEGAIRTVAGAFQLAQPAAEPKPGPDESK